MTAVAAAVTDETLRDVRAEVRGFLRDRLAAGAFAPAPDNWMSGFDPAFSAELGPAAGWA
ncbi:hypothetical protein [Nocardia farcinica]|uniref:hypothetical protein n=1 Tax=Nocardia farcinica TaxID=37329 RepID=UPI0024544A45|nr:hypothetical protein [Nocardia farcinica]